MPIHAFSFQTFKRITCNQFILITDYMIECEKITEIKFMFMKCVACLIMRETIHNSFNQTFVNVVYLS